MGIEPETLCSVLERKFNHRVNSKINKSINKLSHGVTDGGYCEKTGSFFHIM